MKSLRLASYLAISVLSSVASSTIARAGDVVWWAPNWGEARAKELAQKFMVANPGMTIKIEMTVSDGLPQRVLTALRSGSTPDIIEVQHGWVNSYAQADLVVPLDDTIQDKDDYVKAAIDYVTWDGKLWAIPYRIETHGVIYNKDHFKEAGPRSRQAAADLGRTRGRRQGPDEERAVSGSASPAAARSAIRSSGSLPFIWMNGGDIISPDMTKAMVNSARRRLKRSSSIPTFYKQGLVTDVDVGE